MTYRIWSKLARIAGSVQAGLGLAIGLLALLGLPLSDAGSSQEPHPAHPGTWEPGTGCSRITVLEAGPPYTLGLPLVLNKAAAPSPALQCSLTGGVRGVHRCCKTVGDYPNLCVPGACGCEYEDSHLVFTCACGPDRCFDGQACVPR